MAEFKNGPNIYTKRIWNQRAKARGPESVSYIYRKFDPALLLFGIIEFLVQVQKLNSKMS